MRNLLLVLTLLLLGLGGYFGARHFAGSPSVPVLNRDAPCDLGAGPCRHALPGGGHLELALSPRPVPLMQRVRVTVRIEGGDWRPERGLITGLNMRMAPNPVSLAPAGPGRWEGETILPVCSQRRMHWRFALFLEGKGGRRQIHDEFHTSR